MNAPTKFADAITATEHDYPIGEKDFFLPIAILGCLALLLFTLGTHFSVKAHDRGSAQREQVLARNGIVQRVEEVAKMVVPQVMWDDAVKNLDIRYDAAWADANIGAFLLQTDGFDSTFVVKPDGTLLFASSDGKVAGAGRYATVSKLAAPMIASVRRQERARGPFTASGNGKLIAKPIQDSALEAIDGKLAIITATLVQPDFGTALPSGAQAPVVVTVMAVDAEFLKMFADRYLLNGLHVRLPQQPARVGEVEIPATGNDGKPLAYFAWTPLNPGYTLLRMAAVPMAIVFVLFAAVIAWQLRKVHLAARELLWREASYSSLLAELAEDDWHAPQN